VKSDYERFMETFESPNTSKVIRHMKGIGEHDYSNCTPISIEEVVLSLKPNSPKAITTILYVMGLYAKYLGNDDMANIVNDVDRNVLWKLAKPNATRKFISYKQFEETCDSIEKYEEYNSLYISTLFRCLYEGIYNDDMSVVKNLRASDVRPNGVILKPDNGESYVISISERLSNDLDKLGGVNIWERKNRFGTCKIETQGLHNDTCFKVENRGGSTEYAYRFTYYRMLRNVSKNHIGYNVLPLQIYVSGIMHRICVNLRENGIDIHDAFSDNNRDRNVGRIISDELKCSMYETEVRNFREMVKGHIDVFADIF